MPTKPVPPVIKTFMIAALAFWGAGAQGPVLKPGRRPRSQTWRRHPVTRAAAQFFKNKH